MKRAIEKGNIDGAKIYAQNAIRKKTEALNYLRLASRLDAVVSRLDTQAKMNMINSSMSQARYPCAPPAHHPSAPPVLVPPVLGRALCCAWRQHELHHVYMSTGGFSAGTAGTVHIFGLSHLASAAVVQWV